MSTTTASGMTTTAQNKETSPAHMSTTTASGMTTTAENKMTSIAHMSTTPASGTTTVAEDKMTSPTNTSSPQASNMTTAEDKVTTMSTAVSTQSPTVLPNTTVQALETAITNDECGSKQLCVAEPSECNPSETGSCFFLAAKQQSGQNFNFELSGESEGYIAATLTVGSGEGDPTYVCAKSKGNVKFFGTVLNSGVLKIAELNVNSVKGKINGKKIQCSFLATVPQPTVRATVGLSVFTGEFNETTDTLGTPTPVIRITTVNLDNPNDTVINEITNTTTPGPTVAGNNITTASSANNATAAPAGTIITTVNLDNPNDTVINEITNTTTPGPTVAGNNITTASSANNATAAPAGTIIPPLLLVSLSDLPKT
ncbi:uncharacterized protein FYW61_019612 [Anableps anableps]